ncbi:MAG TPA: DsbA family protein [Stenotrophomonas sp.]
MSRLHLPVDAHDHAQGTVDAPITLVEYGDYECPYCGEAYPLLKAVQQALGDRLRLVFRNFPISELHPHALHAAQFAETAAEVGKFWQAHDLLYEHQDALTDEDLFAYAHRLQIDPIALRSAFDGRLDARIQRDYLGGVRSGVSGTPTLFINGARYDGPRDYDSLVSLLEDLASPALHVAS